MNEMPEWWTKAKVLWSEDDAMTSDREGFRAAWKRIFGVEWKSDVVKERFDGGDADFILHENGRVACLSYPGNNEIRLYELEAPEPSMWEMLDKLAGNPDYAVCVMAWPWPDGGWMAGIALHNFDWAERQKMSPAVLALPEERHPAWSMYDGFFNGINAHSTDGPGAVKELDFQIKTIEKELIAKHQVRCSGTCDYCTGMASLAEAPSCACSCPTHGNAFEPPKVTPVGNLNDLLQNVCRHDHDDDEGKGGV